MSPLLRRLGRTTRRPRPEVRDVECRDPRHATALELLGRIDLALRLHDHVITTDLADDVARALLVGQGHAQRALTAAAAEPAGYGRPRHAAGWVSGPAPCCVHGYRLTDSCPGCDALDDQGGPAPIEDPWCSTDLDGARCARPADHVEPCRPAEPVPVVRRPATGDVAQCAAHPFGVRCALVAGHPGTHTSAGLV